MADRVRILLVGDSGVGKTSLLHLICHGKALSHLSYTIGATVDVKLHEFREGTPSQKTYFIELVDVGGSHSHRNSRHVFYTNVHGIILVHDLTNKKSDQNLKKWLRETFSSIRENGKQREANSWDNFDDKNDYDFEDVTVPLLVVGTKLDLVHDRSSPLPVHGYRRSDIADRFETEEIHLNCNDPKSLVAGSSAANKLSRFFDRVVSWQFYKRDKALSPHITSSISVNGLTQAPERRRWN